MNFDNSRRLTHLLAIFYSIISIITCLLFIFAIIVRLNNHRNIGVMLPISGITVLCGILISLYLWRILKNPPVIQILSQKWQNIFNKPKVTETLSVFIIEIILCLLIILFSLNLKLIRVAFIGIFPAFFLVFSFLLITIILLIRFQYSFSHFFNKLTSMNLQDWFLFVAILAGCGIIGFRISNIIISSSILNFNTLIESKNISRPVIFITILVLINFCFLLLGSFSWKEFTHKWKFKNKTINLANKTMILHPVMTAFVISLLFVGGCVLFLRIGYSTNDDIVMIQILSGYIGGIPHAYSVFSNVLLGFLFQQLFITNNEINWVTYFYLLIQFLSIWLLIYSIIKTKTNRFIRFVSMAIVLLFASYILLNLTYTTTAGLSIVSGLYYILTKLISNSQARIRNYVPGICLVIIGSLIRFEALLMIVLFFIPLFLFNIKIFFSKKSLILFSTIVLFLFLSIIINNLFVNNDPKLDAYYKYIKINQQLQDTPRRTYLEDINSVLPIPHWSVNDSYLYSYRFSLDKNVYSETNLSSLSDRIPQWNSDFRSISKKLGSLLSEHPTLEFFYLSLTIMLMIILSTRNRRILFTLLITLLMLFGTSLILIWGFKFPTRISIPMLLDFSLVVLILPHCIDQNSEKNEKDELFVVFKNGGILLSLLLICLSWKLFIYPFESSRSHKNQQEDYSHYVTKLDEQFSNGVFANDSVILAPNAGFPFQMMDPFKLQYPRVKILQGGWNSFSPAYEMELSQHGVSEDPQNFVDNPNLFLLSSDSYLPRVELFFFEHYKQKIKCQLVYITDQLNSSIENNYSFVVYKLVSSDK